MIILWTVGFIVFGALLLTGVTALYVYGLPAWPRRSTPAAPKSPHNPIRECRGCGDFYHESWGCFCPNCSGAD